MIPFVYAAVVGVTAFVGSEINVRGAEVTGSSRSIAIGNQIDIAATKKSPLKDAVKTLTIKDVVKTLVAAPVNRDVSRLATEAPAKPADDTVVAGTNDVSRSPDLTTRTGMKYGADEKGSDDWVK